MAGGFPGDDLRSFLRAHRWWIAVLFALVLVSLLVAVWGPQSLGPAVYALF